MNIIASVFVWSHGRFLLGKKPNGKYCTPGGKVEDGEKVEVAAARELLEETGLWAGTCLEFAGYVEPANKLVMIFNSYGWCGNVCNREPDKCLGWEWMDHIPDNSVEGLLLWRDRKYVCSN